MAASDDLIGIAIPGPWWTTLTYRAPEGASPFIGARVRAAFGSGSRVGVVVGRGSSYAGDIKDVLEMLDTSPAIGEHAIALASWFSATYACGIGTAIKTLSPSSFMKGDPLSPPKKDSHIFAPTRGARARDGAVEFVYDPRDAARAERYASMIADGVPTLICCPTWLDASVLYERIAESHVVPEHVRSGIKLYPRTGGASEWRAWSSVLRGEALAVIGAQSAATAPLPELGRVIIEDESSVAYRTQRSPVYNVRSVLSMRARLEGAHLVLGGRMPSARAFLRMEQERTKDAHERASCADKKVFFVDLKLAYKPLVPDVEGEIAVSEPLVRETENALCKGSSAIWILDRKGYAGEVYCAECGASMTCSRCGGAMRLERGAMVCAVCGASSSIPEVCPSCRGRLLTAKRPGLEAVLPMARSALDGGTRIIVCSDEPKDADIPSGPVLIIGTRGALAHLTRRSVGFVGWLDPDGEARGPEYDARSRAFGMIWESMWRGPYAEHRATLLQTRRPSRDWQAFLADAESGWRGFWRRELDERREYGMPPFSSLIRIELPACDADIVTSELDSACVEYWQAEDGERDIARPVRFGGKGAPRGQRTVIWIRTKKVMEIRRMIEPLFDISRVRHGVPSVTVWHD